MIEDPVLTIDRVLAAARRLSMAERVDLFVALRDELSGVAPPDDDEASVLSEFSPEQMAELDRRAARYQANPDADIPWEQVQSELADRFGEKP